jgi:hypothetical protein
MLRNVPTLLAALLIGKNIVYSHSRSVVINLWLLEGFSPKEGLLQRLHLRD